MAFVGLDLIHNLLGLGGPHVEQLALALVVGADEEVTLLGMGRDSFGRGPLEDLHDLGGLAGVWNPGVHDPHSASCTHGDEKGGRVQLGVQVWSLTQFYSVDFSQSRIGVNKCVFYKRTIKVWVSCC